MGNKLKHAADSELNRLLFGDDQAGHSETIAHVESCKTCRARLDALSGSAAFDTETRNMLAGFFDGRSAGDVQTKSPIEAAAVDCLSPPRHPEMLGRLGRYEIERVIGSGGMGVVFKAFDTELNRPVAIKMLAQHLSFSGAARQRFGREAKAAAAVVHEHVVAIHNVETEGDTPFLVMSYVAGESLQARVDRAGGLDTKEVLRIGIQVAAGLQAAHDQGVVHRDIKPGNILLEQGVERALVTDFGLAQTVDDASLTQTGIVTGTPHYMSPEQAIGKPTDPRSDLFSLGSVLYFMATGRPPFRADKAMGVLNRICHEPHTPVWQDHPEVPDELSDVIDRLLEKKANHRFRSARETQHTLQKSLANLQHPRRSQQIAKRFVRRHRRSLRVASTAAGICLLSVAAVFFWPTAQPAVEQPQPVNQLSAASEPKQFSIETWQQASPAESQRWANSIEQLQHGLQRVEPSSAFDSPATPGWDTQLEQLHQQINQFQSGASAH